MTRRASVRVLVYYPDEAEEYASLIRAPRERVTLTVCATPTEAAPHQDVQEQQLKGGGVRTAMSIEIRDGMIRNPKILSFQRRSAEFPPIQI